MIARSEITKGTPKRGHFVKGGYPRKWTHGFIACLPDCRHIEKGNVPKKWTQDNDKESLKIDSSQWNKDSIMDTWVFLSPRASDTISVRLERMQCVNIRQRK